MRKSEAEIEARECACYKEGYIEREQERGEGAKMCK